MNNKIVIGILVVVVILAGVVYFSMPAKVPTTLDENSIIAKVLDKVGVSPGTDIYNDITTFHGKVVLGGKYLNASTTMTSAKTLTAKQVCENQVISVNSAAVAGTLSAASLDVTLPATSTLFSECLKEEGASVGFWFVNLSPTAATTTQIVAGAGGDIMEPDDGSAFDVEIGGLNRAWIEMFRMPKGFESNLDVIVTVTEFSPAD